MLSVPPSKTRGSLSPSSGCGAQSTASSRPIGVVSPSSPVPRGQRPTVRGGVRTRDCQVSSRSIVAAHGSCPVSASTVCGVTPGERSPPWMVATCAFGCARFCGPGLAHDAQHERGEAAGGWSGVGYSARGTPGSPSSRGTRCNCGTAPGLTGSFTLSPARSWMCCSRLAGPGDVSGERGGVGYGGGSGGVAAGALGEGGLCGRGRDGAERARHSVFRVAGGAVPGGARSGPDGGCGLGEVACQSPSRRTDQPAAAILCGARLRSPDGRLVAAQVVLGGVIDCLEGGDEVGQVRALPCLARTPNGTPGRSPSKASSRAQPAPEPRRRRRRS